MPRPKNSTNKCLRWQVEEVLPETGEIIEMKKFRSLFDLAKHYGISRNAASRLQLGNIKMNQKRHSEWRNRSIISLKPQLTYGRRIG